MAEHPIQGLMMTAMENIKEMVDVNTIIGDPVETPDGQIIIPVSRVGFGFAAGGSEFTGQGWIEVACKDNGRSAAAQDPKQGQGNGKQYPFGGGSGGGVSITPVAFIIVGEKGVRMLSMEGSHSLYDRLLDTAPALLEKLQGLGRKKNNGSSQQAAAPPC